MLVTLIFICFSYVTFAVWAASSWFSLLVLMIHAVDGACAPDPYDQGDAREHPRERTRSGGTGLAMHPSLEMVQASAGRDGAARPPSIPRNRPPAALAGAWTQSAVAYEAV